MKYLLLILILSGCSSVKQSHKIDVQTVEVPIAVSCLVEIPALPIYSFQLLKKEDDIFVKTKVLLADRELSIGYETELLAALKSCK